MTAVAANCLPTEPGLKNGLGLDRHLKLHVGEAETLRPHGLPIARNQESDTGYVLPIHLALHVSFNRAEVSVRALSQSEADQNEKGRRPAARRKFSLSPRKESMRRSGAFLCTCRSSCVYCVTET